MEERKSRRNAGTESKFVGATKFNFSSAVVKSGAKVTASAFPTMALTPTKDKFTLDNKAMRKIGVTVLGKDDVSVEGRVVLMDTDNAYTQLARYFITKGYEKSGKEQGAKLGKGGSFSQSVIWGAMLVDENGIVEVKPADLVAKGLAANSESEAGTKSLIGLKTIDYKVVDAFVNAEGEITLDAKTGDDDNAPLIVNLGSENEPIEQQIWALIPYNTDAHTPKKMSKKA